MSRMPFDLVMLPPHDDLTRRWAKRLADDVEEVNVTVADDAPAAARALESGAPAAFGTLGAELLRNARGLRWLQAPMAAPPEGYYYRELVDHPVVVTNLRGTYTDHVATSAVGMLLALARNLQIYVRDQLAHRWDGLRDADAVLHLPEATVLIVGLGAIGVEIARLLAPFRCRVIGTDARRQDTPPHVDWMGRAEDLDEVLPSADAVIITVPHTPATYRLIDVDRLTRFKPGALLVNIGRGAVVDIDAVADAINADRLRGVALDVFPTEPLDPAHPLWDMPQALITPHVAAVGPYREDRRYAVLRDNARRFASGEELLNVVDKASWF